MRQALVVPYATRVRDVGPEGELVILSGAVVADDGEGSLVIYDAASDEFVLAVRDGDSDPAPAVDIVSCGVRGTAVDCFLSR
jgi:hypothetical protein